MKVLINEKLLLNSNLKSEKYLAYPLLFLAYPRLGTARPNENVVVNTPPTRKKAHQAGGNRRFRE